MDVLKLLCYKMGYFKRRQGRPKLQKTWRGKSNHVSVAAAVVTNLTSSNGDPSSNL